MEWVIDLIKKLVDTKFTGSIRINFYQGGIANINREESLKPPQ